MGYTVLLLANQIRDIFRVNDNNSYHGSISAFFRCFFLKKTGILMPLGLWYCTYLFKLYNVLIILLLTNFLNIICSKISNIRMNSWLAYNCNVKGLEENEKMSRSWMNFPSLTKVIKGAVVVHNSSKFERI